MVGPGATKLIDFGIARAPHVASAERTSLGSLHAMAPEQLRGDQLTPSSDLFAVGAVLYVALTGRVPYPGDDAEAVVASQEAGRPPAPSSLVDGIVPRLDGVVLQALDADPARRFESADAMVARPGGRRPRPRSHRGFRRDDPGRPWSPAPRQAIPPAPSPDRRAGPSAGRHPARRSRAHPGLLLLATLAVAAPFCSAPGAAATSPAPGGGTPDQRQPRRRSLAAGKWRVPDTIGLSEADAEAKARDAGLTGPSVEEVERAQQPGSTTRSPAPATWWTPAKPISPCLPTGPSRMPPVTMRLSPAQRRRRLHALRAESSPRPRRRRRPGVPIYRDDIGADRRPRRSSTPPPVASSRAAIEWGEFNIREHYTALIDGWQARR